MRTGVIASLLFMVLSAAPAWAQEVLSPPQFRDRIATAVRSLGTGLCIRPVDDFTLHFGASPTDCESYINTDNGYRDYITDPSSLDTIVERYLPLAAILLNPRSPLEGEEQDRLVIVIRHKDYLPQEADAISRPFVGDLVAILMLDSPTYLTNFTRARLTELSLSVDQAFDLAAGNLRRRLGPIERGEESGIEIVGAASALISGTLWLPESCTAETEERLALMAERGLYYATDGRDAARRDLFLGFSRNIIAAGESMSTTVLACRSGRWVEYSPTL